MAPLKSFYLQYLCHNQFAFVFKNENIILKNIWLLISQDLHSFINTICIKQLLDIGNPGLFRRSVRLHMYTSTHAQKSLTCDKPHVQIKLDYTFLLHNSLRLIKDMWLYYTRLKQRFFSSAFLRFLLMLTMFKSYLFSSVCLVCMAIIKI